jgi:acetylornithine deacetylase
MKTLTDEAIDLLKSLIETQSFSGEEAPTAALISRWLQDHDVQVRQNNYNVWAVNKHFDDDNPTILLNSHHDTVKPNKAYTRDPFTATVEDGKLYGLGSNDAGGSLVSLLATFVHFYEKTGLKYNLVMVASAEEENSGDNGLGSMLSVIPQVDVAIVGEPTEMHLAVAEKGLVVFDAVVKGTASHAAHPNDNNAIYNCIEVLDWFKNYKFEKGSDALGDVKMTVTQIKAGEQHNAVPSQVELVVDVRVNDAYNNQEIADLLEKESPCDSITPRGLKLNSSSIPMDHDIVKAGIAIGRETYGSPTLSDQAVLSCPSVKLGCGLSQRSHTADEFIYVQEIVDGIEIYRQILEKIL